MPGNDDSVSVSDSDIIIEDNNNDGHKLIPNSNTINSSMTMTINVIEYKHRYYKYK